jgi:hypothetical protein
LDRREGPAGELRLSPPSEAASAFRLADPARQARTAERRAEKKRHRIEAFKSRYGAAVSGVAVEDEGEEKEQRRSMPERILGIAMGKAVPKDEPFAGVHVPGRTRLWGVQEKGEDLSHREVVETLKRALKRGLVGSGLNISGALASDAPLIKAGRKRWESGKTGTGWPTSDGTRATRP